MRENEKNLVVLDGGIKREKKVISQNVTVPIRVMMSDFIKEKAKDKFSVLDLLKN